MNENLSGNIQVYLMSIFHQEKNGILWRNLSVEKNESSLKFKIFFQNLHLDQLGKHSSRQILIYLFKFFSLFFKHTDLPTKVRDSFLSKIFFIRIQIQWLETIFSEQKTEDFLLNHKLMTGIQFSSPQEKLYPYFSVLNFIASFFILSHQI